MRFSNNCETDLQKEEVSTVNFFVFEKRRKEKREKRKEA